MKTNTKWKTWHKITLGVIGAFILLMVIAVNSDDSSFESKVLSAQDSTELHKKKIEDQFSSWDGVHIKLKEYTKDLLNDPESFEHLKTVYWDRDSFITVKMEYTAKNALGGRVRGLIMADCDMDGNIKNIIETQ